ncbi:MAG: sugar kinase [Planctomycetota bacterium]|nr:MAG: sugar kinase [Planctomycetota bacterium]
MSLMVVGTVAFDDVETPYAKKKKLLGGSAMYFASAASYFAPVRLVSVVGEDFGAERLAPLRARGVDDRGVEIAKGKTFHWSGRYEADWNTRTTLATDLNVLATFDPKVPAAYRDSEFVFLANCAPAVQMKALAQVKRPRFVMADTMNLWIDIALADLKRLLGKLDGLVLNDEEARMLTGEKSLIRAARKVLALGPRFVLLKKGEHGAFLIGKDVHAALPAYPVEEVVDPTGAGDCFAGGFMGYVAAAQNAEPATLRRAMLYGTVTASYCVQGFSNHELVKRSRSEIETRYNELAAMIG